MNNLSNLNRALHWAGVLTLTMNASVAADVGQPTSLLKLSTQIQDQIVT